MKRALVRSLAGLACATFVVGACAAPAAATPSPSGPAGGLEAIRARKTLIVAVRVEEPQGGRTPQDPAHRQKRAFEISVAELLAERIVGPGAKVVVRSAGGDRALAVTRGEADIAMVAASSTVPAGVSFSDAYAAGGIVIAVPATSAVVRLEDLAGTTVSVGQDELRAQESAVQLLQQRGVQVTARSILGMAGATQAAEAGETAAVIGDKVGLSVLALARPGSFRILSELERRPAVVAVRNGARDVLAAVNVALRSLLADGAIRDAAAKATLPYESP